MSFTEGARVYHDANQTVPLDSDLILAFNSERWDTDGIHDPVTNNSRLTCKTAGKYVIAAQAHFEQGGVCVRKIKILLNGSTFLIDQAWDRDPDGLTEMNCMTVYNLAVGDYVELEVRNGDFIEAGGWRIMALPSKSPEFMMHRIGPPGIETFSQALSGLKPGTTYHFRAKATNAAGPSYGTDRTFTTGMAAPTVSTDAATQVGQTTATLNGTLDEDGGEDCSVRFEYGETADYGTTTSWQTGKTTSDAFTQEVRALGPSKTYHFRAVARNSQGTRYGDDRTFRTAELSAEAHQALGKGYALGRHEL